MRKRRIKKLVAALRSGEFKQITGQLRDELKGRPCYCVEGVMCELYAKATKIKNMWAPGNYCTLNESNTTAPPEVYEYFFGEKPLFPFNGLEAVSLIDINDGIYGYATGKKRRLGFKGIARLIERKLLNE